MQVRAINTQSVDVSGSDATERQRLSVRLVASLHDAPGQKNACAIKLFHLLNAGDHSVRSVTSDPGGVAGQSISYRGRNRFASALGRIRLADKADHAVIFADDFAFDLIERRSWHRRRLEEYRRILVMIAHIRAARHAHIVFNPRRMTQRHSLCLVVLFVVLMFFVRLSAHGTTQAARIYGQLTGDVLNEPALQDAQADPKLGALRKKSAQQEVRLSPGVLEALFAAQRGTRDDAEKEQLAMDVARLARVARRHDLRNLARLKLLRNRPVNARGAPAESDACNENQRCARSAFGVPVTPYMVHLREALGLTRRFHLKDQQNARKFLEWYLLEAPRHVCGCWVPFSNEQRELFAGGDNWKVPTGATAAPIVKLQTSNARPFPVSADLARHYATCDDAAARFDLGDPIDRIAYVFEFVCRYAGQRDLVEVLGKPAWRYLNAPMGKVAGNVSRLQMLLALQVRLALLQGKAGAAPWTDRGIAEWADGFARQAVPGLAAFCSLRRAKTRAAPTLFLTGFSGSETGIGSNLWMSREALTDAGLSTTCLDANAHMARVAARARVRGKARPDRNFVLHHINAERVPQAVLSPRFVGLNDCYHAGFLLWEFDELPRAHHHALECLDEIWVPSEFVREVYARHTSKPVRLMRKGWDLPYIPRVDLTRLGVPRDAFCFLTCFDFHSSVARKNPMAAVRGFCDAFPAAIHPDTYLIIKSTPADPNHWGDPEGQMAGVRRAAAADSRIRIVEEFLDWQEFAGLIKSVDCLVSPHRAEGFGLVPAYALTLGTPVISTDYSGTRDFCTPRTCLPVPHRLIDVDPQFMMYPVRGARWAEIDHGALVEAFRYAAAHPDRMAERRLAGRRLMRKLYSRQAQAARYEERLESLGVISRPQQVHRKRA